MFDWVNLETVAVVLSIAYLVLAMKENSLCWYCAFFSTAIYVAGLSRGSDGRVICKNKVIFKLSRTELASMAFKPAPQRILDRLLADGTITAALSSYAYIHSHAEDATSAVGGSRYRNSLYYSRSFNIICITRTSTTLVLESTPY